MTLPRFDQSELIRKLEELPADLRAAFAAASAQRVVSGASAHASTSTSPQVRKVQAMLHRLWDVLLGAAPSTEASELLRDCAALVPDEEGREGSLDESLVEDAVAATYYALTAVQSGASRDALSAARRAYDALDTFVIETGGFRSLDENVEQRLANSSPIQAELARQARDLVDLRAISASDGRAAVGALRDRAVDEGGRMFSS